MNKYLDYLFIKNKELDENIFSNSLFISFDKISALRMDYNTVLKLIKIYDSYEIIKENIRALHEGYSQGLFILKLNNELYFLRLIICEGQIYDALIYSKIDYDYINRIFFSMKIVEIPSAFLVKLCDDRSVVILNEEEHGYRILKANKCFYDAIGYEDWDYANKYQNILNQITVDKIDFDNLSLYKSDHNIINIGFDVFKKDNIYCIVEK